MHDLKFVWIHVTIGQGGFLLIPSIYLRMLIIIIIISGNDQNFVRKVPMHS